MSYYRLIRDENLFVVLSNATFGAKIWTQCIVRKQHTCALLDCDNTIEKGTTAWRPITNGGNRMHRLCEDCVAKLREPK